MKTLSLALVAYLVTLTACGGSGNSSASVNSPSQMSSVSGNWLITLQSSAPNAQPKNVEGFLLQSGNNVIGNLAVLGSSCAGTGPVTGSATGQNISLSVAVTGRNTSFTGAIAQGGSSMSGNYSILAAGCGASEDGTWTGTQVPSVTGSFTGTLTSRSSGPLGGKSFTISGTVTQGPNTGSSSTTLSGSVTSNSPCFSSASLNGVISGTSVLFSIVAPDGSEIGSFGASSNQVTTPLVLTGLGSASGYRLAAQPQQAGCRLGDFGDVSISLP